MSLSSNARVTSSKSQRPLDCWEGRWWAIEYSLDIARYRTNQCRIKWNKAKTWSLVMRYLCNLKDFRYQRSKSFKSQGCFGISKKVLGSQKCLGISKNALGFEKWLTLLTLLILLKQSGTTLGCNKNNLKNVSHLINAVSMLQWPC